MPNCLHTPSASWTTSSTRSVVMYFGQGIQQRDVRRHVADPQVAAGQHHAVALGPGQRGQHLGVPGKPLRHTRPD